MRIIDADALIKELSTMYKSPTSTEDFMTVGYDKAIADVVVTTHRQPTADVVEVVRCKDCKYHDDEEPGAVYCPDRVGGWVAEDFFCAEGKRRDDEPKAED